MVLDDAQSRLLREEQDMLKKTLDVLENIGASKDDIKCIKVIYFHYFTVIL